MSGQFAQKVQSREWEDPAYRAYMQQAYPGAQGPQDYWKYGTPDGTSGYQIQQKFQPMNYAQWKALTSAIPGGGGDGGGGGGGGTTPPPTPPPELLGLIEQTANPFAVYGQMGVMEPYLSQLNQRFGWDPAGVAYGQQLNPQLPTWYQPETIYPKTLPLKISGGTTK